MSVRHDPGDLMVYDQRDERFLAGGDKTLQGLRLAHAGCGILSFCNAVCALNGSRPDAVRIGQWAMGIGAYRPDEAGTYRMILYDNVERAFGEELGFRVVGQHWGTVADERLVRHLLSDGTAVVHVDDHFLAIVGYDPQDTLYRVIESKVSLRRRLRQDSWVPGEKLSSGPTCVDWHALLASRQGGAGVQRKGEVGGS